MTASIDSLMEDASRALVAMDYPACEAGCLAALALARDAGDWAAYARILLPLQESRRQRRMIATDAGVRVGHRPADAPREGCIVILPPGTADDARRIEAEAHADRRCIEVMRVTSAPAAPIWTVANFNGPAITCDRPAPPNAAPDVRWYLEASESLGDAAIAAVDADPAAAPGSLERVERLESMLAVVVDHEKLHQRLGDAARALTHAGAPR